ncbi:MAG TPA: PilX N-terminal domain-containing pilus assembly protein [Lysobacter sp.]|nr:PilX N-terminal domain-containing pilus assembly protein [Lysobacter sp.]
MTPIRQQRGATLMVTLIMLVILTLFALTAFNLSSVNLRIVGNFQQQRLAESLVQQALEQVMSTVSLFTTPAALCLPSGAAPSGTPLACALASDVLIDRPRCNYTAPAKGYTKKIGELTPEDTNWEVRASYTDSLTKASVVIVQGVGVRMLAGNCPTS